MKKRVLVVDDESTILESVRGILEDEGYEVTVVSSGQACLDILQREPADLVILDIWMPGMDGLEVLQRIKRDWPFLPVVIMTGHGTIETAVKATRMGAHDFIEKPLSYESLLLSVENALKYKELEDENTILRQRTDANVQDIIGMSPVMLKLKEQITIIAPTDAWVLIRGENGTGKELVAQTIHRMSKRSHKPLVEVNCAAIPEELIESELFGYEKGAFTGATTTKRGKFELANGGALFLDEIGDMSLKTQAKVLRILQEQRFERVGGNKTIHVDVRIIAATNKDMEREIAEGRFREDLYYRINVIPIEIPPLRERVEDIPLLLEAFVSNFAKKMGKRALTIDPKIYECLQAYSWPGNVRELRNLAERLVILSKNDVITCDDLPQSYRAVSKGRVDMPNTPCAMLYCEDFRSAKAMFEREYIAKKLMEHHGNITKTAEAIGIERRHLHRKIQQLGLEDKISDMKDG